jgi:cytoskeletal protein CcmA (bactofilin family)
MKGELSTKRGALLEGIFEGTIRSAATVEIAVKGRCTGELHCEALECGGALKAEVRVAAAARFLSTSTLEGKLFTRRLAIERGASIQGRIEPLAANR